MKRSESKVTPQQASDAAVEAKDKSKTAKPQEDYVPKTAQDSSKSQKTALDQPADQLQSSRVARHRKKIKLAVIICGSLGVLLLASAIFLLVVRPGSIRVNTEAENKIREIMTSNASNAEMLEVKSDFGFEVAYDVKSMTATGQEMSPDSNSTTYSAQTYKDEQLKTARSYVILEIGYRDPKGGVSNITKDDSNKDVPTYTSVRPYLTISTSRVKDYFDRSTMPEEYRDKSKYSDLDMLAIGTENDIKKRNGTFKTSNMKIGGLDFKLVDETSSFTIGNQTITRGHTYSYMTVQNGRPYTMTINMAKPDREADIGELESIIRTMKFPKPSSSAKFRGAVLQPAQKPTIRLANTADSDAIDNTTTNTPAGYVSSSSLINVVARNQISTVRIGVFRCADLSYRAANGATATIKGLCNGGVGSGSIISKDGYVATNGHVTDLTDDILFRGMATEEQIKTYYDFIIRAGYATSDDIIKLQDQLKAGDDTAAEKIYGFISLVPKGGVSSSNDQTKYIVQTSNDPIRIEGSDVTSFKWKYNSTNLEARYVASEVDNESSGLDPDSDKSDVAILKINGDFPALKLGNTSRLNDGDTLTAIGYPAAVDNGLGTKQATTVPSVTQGKLEKAYTVGGNHKLFVMTTQIASGNSGGPTIDDAGEQIGLNTYGSGKCTSEDDASSCFGYGISRDIDDIKTLARDNGVSISPDGEMTRLWASGIEDFAQGKYSSAAKSFSELDQKYPDNYLVKKFLEVSQSTPDTATGTNGDMLTTTGEGDISDGILVIFLFVGGTLFVLAVVGVILLIVQANKRPRYTQYAPYNNPNRPTYTPQPNYQRPAAPAPTYYNAQPQSRSPQPYAPPAQPRPQTQSQPQTQSYPQSQPYRPQPQAPFQPPYQQPYQQQPYQPRQQKPYQQPYQQQYQQPPYATSRPYQPQYQPPQTPPYQQAPYAQPNPGNPQRTPQAEQPTSDQALPQNDSTPSSS